MKALFIGYSKCGTKTMSVVFRTLGYRVYDFPEHFGDLSEEWTKIFNKGYEPGDFKKMYAGVDASVDNPVYHFWEEMLKEFPDVKLLVNYRNEEAWLKSFIDQINSVTHDRSLQILYILSATNRKMANTIRLFNYHVWGGDGKSWPWQTCRGINYTLMRHRYRQHNLYIQERAPENQLHVVDFSKGWEPICEFLGEPIPDEPFPHANKSGEMINEIITNHPSFATMKREAQTTVAIITVLVAVTLFYLFRCFLV